MASEFKSNQVQINAPIERVYARYSDMENLKRLIDNAPEGRIPADKLEQLKAIEVTPDSIMVPGGPTGAIKMNVVERVEPTLVSLRPEGIPINLDMQLRFTAVDENTTTAVAAITADIPMMLRPMVKGPLQKVVDQFAEMMQAIPFES